MTPRNGAIARDDPITEYSLFGHSEITAPMGYKLIDFDKTSFIEKKMNAFPRRHFPSFVLLFDAISAAPKFSLLMAGTKKGSFFFQRHKNLQSKQRFRGKSR